MTGKQLREATGLPRRTVYTALRRLRELGVLHERSSLRDTRQTYFWVGGEPDQHPAHAERRADETARPRHGYEHRHGSAVQAR